MNEWEIAAVVLIAALVPCVGVAVFADALAALIAVELCGVLSTVVLVLLSEGFHRQPFVDLAVVLAVLSVVGSLTFARLIEKDL
jgi:multisubunit Na+/H+ antiporter MnhF subunit